jgi:hypothetical protein
MLWATVKAPHEARKRIGANNDRDGERKNLDMGVFSSENIKRPAKLSKCANGVLARNH